MILPVTIAKEIIKRLINGQDYRIEYILPTVKNASHNAVGKTMVNKAELNWSYALRDPKGFQRQVPTKSWRRCIRLGQYSISKTLSILTNKIGNVISNGA